MLKKMLSALLVTIIAFSSAMSVSANAMVNEKLNTGEIVQQKVYSTTTIEDEFDESKVVVVIFHEYSGLDKEFSEDDFPGVDIKNINYITSLKDPDKDYPYLNIDEYCQILELELNTTGKENVLNAIEVLETNPIVMSAEVGGTYLEGCSVDANDTYISEQYALDKIQAPEAWDLTTGSTSVTVGVIDSGICNHTDLNANLVTGKDFVNNSTVTTDDYDGHGTMIASIIGAKGNNSTGIAGVAWDVKLMPLQVTSGYDTEMDIRDTSDAIDYAAEEGIPILIMAYIGDTSNYLEISINNYNGLICCPAGNSGKNLDTNPAYPACNTSNNIITVAATTSSDTLWSSSNYGKQSVDIAAPGVNIKGISSSSTYASKSGTTYATAYVAGAAALLLSYNPNLTAEEMKFALTNNVDTISSLSSKIASGGRLNVYKALSSLLSGDKARVYKTRISITSSSDQISWANIVLNNELGKCTYYDYVNGTMAQYDQYASISVLGNGNIDYLYNSETYLLARSGILADFKYKSRFSSLDCTEAIDMTYEYFGSEYGVQLDVSTTIINVLVGDVNSDNLITSADAQLVLQYAGKIITLSESQVAAADVNDDGVINSTDAQKINQYAAKLIDSF